MNLLTTLIIYAKIHFMLLPTFKIIIHNENMYNKTYSNNHNNSQTYNMKNK